MTGCGCGRARRTTCATPSSGSHVPLKRRGLYAGATSRLGWATGGCLTSQDLLNFKKAGAPSFKDMEPPFQAMGQHYWRTGGVQGNTANAPFSLLYDDNDDLVV